MKRCALVLAAVLLSVTALAGCGSADDEAADAADTASTSGDDSSESPDEESQSDDSGDTSDSEKSDQDDKEKDDRSGGEGDADEPADDDNESGETGDTKKKSDDSDDAKSANAVYCGMVKRLMTDFDPSNSASLAAARDLDAIVDRLEEVTDGAPTKVRPSWQRLTVTFQSFADLVNKYDIDLSDPNAYSDLKAKEKKELAKVLQQYQSPQLAKATDAIKADSMRRCHVKLG